MKIILIIIVAILAFSYAPISFAFGFLLAAILSIIGGVSIISILILGLLTAVFISTGWYEIWWAALFLFPICWWAFAFATMYLINVISIFIAPDKLQDTPNIDDLKYQLNHGSHNGKPAFALHLSEYYRDKDYELSVKYACLAVEMVDSLTPSDLMGSYKKLIAADQKFCALVYSNIINDKYASDNEYAIALNGYRCEQSSWQNQLSMNISIERKRKMESSIPK